MAATIVKFPYKASPISKLGQFFRLGETSYRRHASLFAEGHLKAKRIVVDASVIRHLKDEIGHFREAGVEVILDTKVAELAALQRAGGNPSKAPWAVHGGLLGPRYFDKGHSSDVIGHIARIAVEYRVDAVLAPCHFVGDPGFDGWLDVDRRSCIYLRDALDRAGGKNIAIDYTLIAPHLLLNQSEFRQKAIEGISDLPFDNLWLRASGFGSDSKAQPICHLISSIVHLHNLGKPIVIDYVGGLVGEAVLAFNAASGFAHGIGEIERFDARQWHVAPKEPEPDRPMGRARRVSIGAINKSLTIAEYETLLSARGGKRLLVPQLEGTAIKSGSDIVADPKIVAALQSASAFEKLNSIPDIHRPAHFLRERLTPAVELVKQIKNLRPSSEVAIEKKVDLGKLMARFDEHSKDLSRQQMALETLADQLRGVGAPMRPIQRLTRDEQSARGEEL
ncbi:conserved hypothetical protein [uncultured Pleomorphomonas sp.]|uniref:Uncharacterized protein n=1 Tax=uncultured Pleomorphomonas sp. TaxID=442121 RepID=A0A212L407_9HYPH|nr:hypothetical protein [uncultured Pleomorphomonas sp.]SCM72258.1 conserved hypothetical protein [uncultured Pleomorphomonas sp.]